jgi:hypothetical protein
LRSRDLTIKRDVSGHVVSIREEQLNDQENRYL